MEEGALITKEIRSMEAAVEFVQGQKPLFMVILKTCRPSLGKDRPTQTEQFCTIRMNGNTNMWLVNEESNHQK